MLKLLKRFRDDERGAFLVLFGVLAVVLVATSGAVVDYTTVEQARTRGQVALDSAALALQSEIYTLSEEQIRQAAEDLISERIGDSTISVEVESADVDTDEGQLFLQARLSIPTSFLGLVGVDEINARLISEATRKQLNVEVAFVLDNSGSMQGTKIAQLKLAAKNAINILFYGSTSPGLFGPKNEDVKVGIVPFTFFVNVGSGYSSASWIDKNGNSSIANDNFDDDDDESTPFTDAVDRIALIESMSGQSWKGCVEMRPYPYSVDDTTPSAGTPDTLFVPSFAPDEPGDAGDPDAGFNNSYVDDDGGTCTAAGGSSCFCYKWSKWWVDGGNYCYQYDSGMSVTAQGTDVCSCDTYDGYYDYNGYYGHIRKYWCPGSGGSSLSDRELQERICKYDGASVSFGSWPPHEDYTQGPNAGCPDADIEPLTDDVTTLQSKVTAMVADGGTNIHQAAAWGFRTLSPTEPFTEGNDYNTATSKVMIIMTDGENTYWDIDNRYDPGGSPNMNGTYYYMPYGYLWNERLGTYGVDDQDSMKLKMNDRTLETCTNAKDAGITIYTVGLNPPNTTTQTMLEDCSSGSGYYYFPLNANELDGVFAEIVAQLSDLRLAQ